MATEEILGALRDYFTSRHPEIAVVYVFGSVARGSHTETSDIDVAVLYSGKPPQTLEGSVFDLRVELGSLLSREVDAIVLNDAPPDLVHEVLRKGELVLDR